MNNNGYAKKQLIASAFNRAALGYGRLSYLPPFGRRLVELAQVQAGAQVLDIASGRGAVLFPLAERVGPYGQAIGIDLSSEMVWETGAEIKRRGLRNVQLYCMDAEGLKFPDASFDTVLCGFALFFFPHLQQALSEIRRVLKPQGRLAVSTWGAHDERWNWCDELLSTYQPIVKLRSQMLDTPAELQAVLHQAGFVDIRLITEEADWVCADAEAWWATQWSISIRATLEQMAPAVLERYKAEVFEKIQALKQPDGIHTCLQAHLAVGTKPYE